MSARSNRASLSRRLAWAGVAGTLTLALSPAARAQIDAAPPLPNVLLLVDTSGSMEFKTDSTAVTCNPGNTSLTNEKSRWVNVVEALTGTFSSYSCESLDRATDGFKLGTAGANYQLPSGTAPYDWRYPIPYHRPLSGGALGCSAAPGTLPGANPFKYPANAIAYKNYASGVACTPSQNNDGIIDSFGSRVRFGLMTFDTEVNPGTGYTGSGPSTASVNLVNGVAGLWSYVLDNNSSNVATGAPAGCAPATPQEVGARNGAAPAWEGRMINFGNPNDTERAYETKRTQIQEVLVATRPFGATPIAGMLKDAENFFWEDKTTDAEPIPASATGWNSDYGPWQDKYIQCNVNPREQIVVLLTDGEPNMDLRPYCEGPPPAGLPAGKCPFPDKPEQVTDRLFHPPSSSRKPIRTYVVGYALQLVDADLNPATAKVLCGSLAPAGVLSTQCAAAGVANDPELSACCTLHRIAIAGGGQAFFANDAAGLKSALSSILSKVIPTTTRTQPAVSGGGSLTGGYFRFFSASEPAQERPWSGQLTRERWTCDTPVGGGPKQPVQQPITVSMGDDFVENVNTSPPANRRFYTFVPKDSSGVIKPGDETVRTNFGSIDWDGAGILAPEIHAGLANTFATGVPAKALAIPVASYPAGITLEDDARTFFLKWLVGVNAGTDTYHRCPPGGPCELIGDIFHSTPQIVGTPTALLRDESYARFALENNVRPLVLYTSTNDGFLHAFKITSNNPVDLPFADKMVMTKANNELWAFAPPAVLPGIYTEYPFTHQFLLDGIAAIKDVVAVKPVAAGAIPTVFRRTAADAQGGAGTWRTVLVQGFGPEKSGYFAVDVTTPVPDTANPDDVTKGGPRFLWQLTKDTGGNLLFGRGGSTPAIATLFFVPRGETDPMEVPVAILPGGRGGTRVSSGTGCPAAGLTLSGVSIDSSFPPRTKGRCYTWGAGDSEIGARSLTIVRLDTGEIVRTFRKSKNAPDILNATLRNLVTEVEIEAPITGQPVPFPGQPGAVADRILVGDDDGRLWKVDVSKKDPAQWTMKLFFDLYPTTIASVAENAFDAGQPIATAPVVSVDATGNVTVNVASGDQDALSLSTTQKSYVYSLTDQLNTARTALQAHVNWFQRLEGGERVVGPLALFNTKLFFATYQPDQDPCLMSSKVWGFHYLDQLNKATGGASTAGSGGETLADFGNVKFLTAAAITGVPASQAPGIFGVAIAQVPTCYRIDDDATGDDLVGFKNLRRISEVVPGKFQLLMHTGPTAGSAPGQRINTVSRDLASPVSESRIASWASILD